MEKFLEKRTLQKLAHKEVENLNWSITSKKIEIVIKILHIHQYQKNVILSWLRW